MEEDAENRDDDPRNAEHPVRIVFPHQAGSVHQIDKGFGLGFSKSTICEISAYRGHEEIPGHALSLVSWDQVGHRNFLTYCGVLQGVDL